MQVDGVTLWISDVRHTPTRSGEIEISGLCPRISGELTRRCERPMGLSWRDRNYRHGTSQECGAAIGDVGFWGGITMIGDGSHTWSSLCERQELSDLLLTFLCQGRPRPPTVWDLSQMIQW